MLNLNLITKSKLSKFKLTGPEHDISDKKKPLRLSHEP